MNGSHQSASGVTENIQADIQIETSFTQKQSDAIIKSPSLVVEKGKRKFDYHNQKFEPTGKKLDQNNEKHWRATAQMM